MLSLTSGSIQLKSFQSSSICIKFIGNQIFDNILQKNNCVWDLNVQDGRRARSNTCKHNDIPISPCCSSCFAQPAASMAAGFLIEETERRETISATASTHQVMWRLIHTLVPHNRYSAFPVGAVPRSVLPQHDEHCSCCSVGSQTQHVASFSVSSQGWRCGRWWLTCPVSRWRISTAPRTTGVSAWPGATSGPPRVGRLLSGSPVSADAPRPHVATTLLLLA